jgi:hypothetical protein
MKVKVGWLLVEDDICLNEDILVMKMDEDQQGADEVYIGGFQTELDYRS